tara:strand:+ start:839 stop:1993 length:1155 start_codon:yes stop_codon:yes gene_type:complete
MKKGHNYNILDLGSSKLRFSIFDDKSIQQYSEIKPLFNQNLYLNSNEQIVYLIKNAEKKISSHVQDIVLMFDTYHLISVDLSLSKNLDESSELKKVYNSLLLELNQIINSNYSKYKIIHTILSKCTIDDVVYANFPEKINKVKNIKIEFKLICFPQKEINFIKENFNKNNLNITHYYCSSYLKTLFYLEKMNHNNISFLEIGLKKSLLLNYENNKLKSIYTVPIGGYHISNDISKIFKIDFSEAEKIKKLFNKSDTEFSYDSKQSNNNSILNKILSKNIQIDLLKKVILYRVQEIIDMIFEKSNSTNKDYNDNKLFLIGEGSLLFNNNTFHLNDKFEFKSINFCSLSDVEICKAGLKYLHNHQLPVISNKKSGIFEKFFNLLGK